MTDVKKTKGQLVEELAELRQRIAALEANDEKLRQSDRQEHSLLDSAPLGVADCDVHGIVTFANPMYQNMLGYSEAEIVGKHICERVADSQQREELPAYLQYLASEQPPPTPYFCQDAMKDGRIIDVQVDWNYKRDSQGNVVGFVSVFSDITKQRQVETALRASEAKYRKLHESMMDAFVSVDMNGRIQDCNESFCRMLGYDREELLALTYVDITPAEWHPFEAEIIEEQILSRGYSDTYEKEYRRKDSTILPVELRIFLIRNDDGQPSAKWAIVRDITERKQVEAALRESKAELQQVASSISDYLWSATVDCTGKVTYRYYSPVVEQITGRPPEFYMSGPDAWVSTIHPDDRLSIVQAATRITSRKSSYESAEYRVVRPDGTIRWVQDKTTVRQMEDGNLRLFGTVSDITERKRAEEALQKAHDDLERRVEERTAQLRTSHQALLQSELMFRNYFEQSLVGMAATTIDGHWLEVNERICEILGYSRDDLLRTTWLQLTHPDDLEKDMEQFNLLLAGRIEHYTLDKRFLKKDGCTVYTTINIRAFRKEDGSIDHIVGLMEDITRRKEAEEALRKSEERFRSYFEQALMGMAISDKEMRWTEVNDRFCEILGYSKEEVLHRKITDFVHSDDSDAFHRSYRQILAGGIDHYTVDRRYIRKDGNVVYLNIFVKVLCAADGTADNFLALFDDVTERRKSEEALRQSHEELRTIHEEMADGIGIVTVENPHLLRANTALRRMLGYSKEEIVSLSPTKVNPPEVMPIIQEQLEIAKQKGIVRSSDFPFLRKDGTIFYADVAVSQIRYNGQPCWISVIHDVTERKEAEEALRREHRTLKHLLQSSDHERQTIAYDIHDGLAQYLAAAIMQFDVYKGHQEKRPNEATKAYDAAITLLCQGHSEARRLIAGIRHPVLDEAGVIEAVAHLINQQNREKGPKIEFHSLVDFSRLAPLLENVIYRIIQEGMTNACKYSQSSRVRITLLQQKDRLRIEIRDWGIGFNPKNVTEGSYGLTGIRERARLLGGKYRIQSAAGKGSRIVVELPLMERER